MSTRTPSPSSASVRNLFSQERFATLAAALKPAYVTADPFPHIVTDDFLPPEIADRLLQEFPDPGSIEWKRQENLRNRKLSTESLDEVSDYTYDLLNEFNTPPALRFIQELTGIPALITDPYFTGGGLHQIERDGFLKIHADFNMHPTLKVDRRINLLLYMNKDWEESYGGHLELWDRTMSRCVKKVLPVFNRCVVFSTLDWAFHGHPEPLTCPAGRTRKSVALYYYSNGRPAEEKSADHNTLYQTRPDARVPGAGMMVRRIVGNGFRGLGQILAAPGKLIHKLGKKISPADD